MFTLNNFKEANIVPNEDGTYNIKFNGVKFQSQNGGHEATVTYPRVKMQCSTLDMSSMYRQIDVTILKDNDDKGTLFSICMSEEE